MASNLGSSDLKDVVVRPRTWTTTSRGGIGGAGRREGGRSLVGRREGGLLWAKSYTKSTDANQYLLKDSLLACFELALYAVPSA